MSGSQDLRAFQNFAQNTKKTAVGVKFTKTLFTEPERLNQASIKNVLISLGVNVPQELELSTAAAQVIMSGQALNSGLDAGKNLSELQGPTNAGAGAIKSIAGIAEVNGWLDNDSAQITKIGSDVLMIVGSLGTNVQAWISLAMDLANTVAIKQGLADVHAIQDAQNKYRGRVSPQAAILGDTFKDFQESKISIFGVIAKMAAETPDLWPQVINPNSAMANAFPDLLMVPTVSTSVTGYGSAEIGGSWPWPASGKYVLARWDADKVIGFQTLQQNFNKETAAEYFFELLLKPWLTAYSIANNEIISRGNMSMQNIAALTYLVKPDGEISDTYDYVNMLIGANLTPYDFGDNRLEKIADDFVEEHYQASDKTFKESGVSKASDTLNKTWGQYEGDLQSARLKLMQVQQSDDITILTNTPYIYSKLKSYMDFEQTSFEKDPTLGGQINAKFGANSPRAWRSLHNYFSVLNMLDTFRTDSYLSQTRYAKQLVPFMPSVASFDSLVKRLNYLSVGRSVNRLATANIASYLGTTSKNLVRLTGASDTGATKYSIKG